MSFTLEEWSEKLRIATNKVITNHGLANATKLLRNEITTLSTQQCEQSSTATVDTPVHIETQTTKKPSSSRKRTHEETVEEPVNASIGQRVKETNKVKKQRTEQNNA